MSKTDAAETLSKAIEALTEDRSIRGRRNHANTAHAALRALFDESPPADAGAVERTGYQQGLLKAITIAKEALEVHEAPIVAVQHNMGAAYAVLNGLRHFAQSITSTFETLVQRELMASLKAGRDAKDATP
jgi:hypothetical protein